MKKQFFRVKQLADQTFLRAEKSKQLSDELQDADQKVEYLRGALAAVSKRLPQSSSSNSSSSSSVQEKENFEKRLKKLVEYQLGIVMKEYGTRKEDTLDGEDTLLRPVLHKCGKAQMELAREMSEHECKIENMVSQPIQTVLETDIPAILKTKRTLSKLILDKDSATNRYQTASKHGTKNESIRDEMEEAEQKVEHCRDSLAAEMFSLLRRESEFAQFMLQLMKLQRGYHESALHTLEELIPELEKEIGNSPVKAIYGCPLEEHLRLSKRQIALPLELCVCALWELGMSEEGLFRVAGGTSRVRRMKLSLDSGCFSPPLQFEYRDVHVIASALKSYLRELPEPLLTYQLYGDWIRAIKYPSEEQRIDAINHVLHRLPVSNYDNLRYLIKFLAALSQNPANKMSTSNIAIVMAPNLLWSVHEISNGIDMTAATIVNSIVEILLSHVDVFFPGDIKLYFTFKRDDLFPDLTEFERPAMIVHHLRSSSNDTALINLTEHSDICNNSNNANSPNSPHESPKPVSRKKNKPAPVPPLISTGVGPSSGGSSSTLNRTKKQQNQTEDLLSDDPLLLNRRKSLDLHHINKNDISAPIQTETTANINVLNVNQINVNKMRMVDCSKPVAAPRTSLLTHNSNEYDTTSTEIVGEEVQLRRTGKPAIPERPATLRPSSFRATKTNEQLQLMSDEIPTCQNQSASTVNQSALTSLERTQIYSVPDKQQVSYVKLQQMKEKGHDCQMAEKEKFLNNTITTGACATTATINTIEDVMKSMERLNTNGAKHSSHQNMHHARTLSDGDIIDTIKQNVGNVGVVVVGRPPRPQPPPPPPPAFITAATTTTTTTTTSTVMKRPKSDGESTDL